MTQNLIPLETLKARDASLGVLITCTEADIGTITAQCLSELQRQLDGQPQSREAVTSAVVMCWTAAHMTFFDQHGIGPGPQMGRIYDLSATWLRQRLLAAQLSGHVPAVPFAQDVTLGERPRRERSPLPAALTHSVQTAMMASGSGWDAALLAASEVLADTITELYRIRRLPYEQDLWPLAASLIGWDELSSANAHFSIGT